MSLSQIEFSLSQSQSARESVLEWIWEKKNKMAEFKMGEFKMAAIIKLKQIEWAKFS